VKIKNRHGRVGVKKSLTAEEKRAAYTKGVKRGLQVANHQWRATILSATSLRTLKKELNG
jgi:hypothetical protein